MVNFRNATHTRATTPQLRVSGAQVLWVLMMIEFVMLAALVVALASIVFPERSSLQRGADVAFVRDAIAARAAGAVADPVIEIAPGLQTSASSLRGFALDGTVYYYYYERQAGYDPLSRGVVSEAEIDVLLREEVGTDALVIYRLQTD